MLSVFFFVMMYSTYIRMFNFVAQFYEYCKDKLVSVELKRRKVMATMKLFSNRNSTRMAAAWNVTSSIYQSIYFIVNIYVKRWHNVCINDIKNLNKQPLLCSQDIEYYVTVFCLSSSSTKIMCRSVPFVCMINVIILFNINNCWNYV